jgi:hypothetical protein
VSAQEAIPVDDSPPIPRNCAWCGSPAFDTLEVEPARFRNHNGVRVVAKPARLMPVCVKHYKSIARHQ